MKLKSFFCLIVTTLTEGGGPEAIAAKKPLVGTPHFTRMGELLLLISYPIFDTTGQYLGYLGGSLYLKKDSILNELGFNSQVQLIKLGLDGKLL